MSDEHTTKHALPLLERDSNIPPLPKLMREVDKIAAIQAKHTMPASRMAIGLNIGGLQAIA